MENVMDTINQFIISNKYLENKHLLGIILYGSYATRTNTTSSDIDLMFIFDNSFNSKFKGYCLYNGFKIEYFEQSIDNIIKRMENDYKKCENTIFSIFNNCKIIYEVNDTISNLILSIQNFNKKPLPKLEKNETIYQIVSLKSSIEKLYNMRYNISFYSYYFLILNKISKFVHLYNGYSIVSDSKIYKLYSNKNIRTALSKEVPEQIFMDMYIDALQIFSPEENYKKIDLLFQYILDSIDIKINFSNLKLDISNKYY